MTDARYRSPWEVPDCPDCGGHVFVSGHDHPDRGAWHCHACGATFDGEVPRRASREGVEARPIGDGRRLIADGGDELAARRAEGIVNALTDHDETTCSDCGETVDLSGATDPMAVVLALEEHRKSHGGGDPE